MAQHPDELSGQMGSIAQLALKDPRALAKILAKRGFPVPAPPQPGSSGGGGSQGGFGGLVSPSPQGAAAVPQRRTV